MNYTQIDNLINEYINNISCYSIGKNSIKYDCCKITFIKTKKINEIIVFEIYIFKKYRNKGSCKYFLQFLVDNIKEKSILCIETVLSIILHNILLNFMYNGKRFILKKQGYYLVSIK